MPFIYVFLKLDIFQQKVTIYHCANLIGQTTKILFHQKYQILGIRIYLTAVINVQCGQFSKHVLE